MLQWATARIGAILVTLNPAYRGNEIVDALAISQVQHLFVVPHIRSSAYLQMLSSIFPSLSSTPQGQPLSLDRLPDLKSIVVIDDVGGGQNLETEMARVKPAVDFREILVWREAGHEESEVRKLEASLQEHDVINLQFTRYVLDNCRWISY